MSSVKVKFLLFGLKLVLLHHRGAHDIWCRSSPVVGPHGREVTTSFDHISLRTNVGRKQGSADTLTFTRG